MSQRGKLGRDAATRSRKDLSQRPKKSQPSQSSQPSQQKSDIDSDDEEGTFSYQFEGQNH
jgi:hypothetical protein